jgi:hypothetical protein
MRSTGRNPFQATDRKLAMKRSGLTPIKPPDGVIRAARQRATIIGLASLALLMALPACGAGRVCSSAQVSHAQDVYARMAKQG